MSQSNKKWMYLLIGIVISITIVALYFGASAIIKRRSNNKKAKAHTDNVFVTPYYEGCYICGRKGFSDYWGRCYLADLRCMEEGSHDIGTLDPNTCKCI